MKRCIFTISMCCILAGCGGGVKMSDADWNSRYAGSINNNTTGVAVSGGDLYVYGSYEKPLKKISLAGGELVDLPAEYIVSPHGLRAYNGSLWITDTKRHQVFELDLCGRVLRSLGQECVAAADSSHFNAPTDVAVADNGNIYVTDGYGNSRVVCFDKNGGYLFEWGKEGKEAGEFKYPHNIVIADEKVFVADRENCRVQIFTLTGDYIGQWNKDGKVFGLCHKDGVIYMTIQSPGRDYIEAVDLKGDTLYKLGEKGGQYGRFDVPHSLAVDGDYIYVAEVGNKRIQRIKR